MTYEVERRSVMRQFLRLEWRLTVVAFIRAIPSIVFWIGLFAWIFM